LTRITGLLLPIRYPNSFYTATITDPVIASLSRVAIYHDHPVAEVPGVSAAGTDKVIGGIRCRLERIPQPEDSSQEPQTQGGGDTNLYIQTLHLLSPYRSHGVAASLLNALLFASPPDSKNKEQYQVSGLVKHYNIRSVTAHVHEANEDAMNWYLARGFEVDGHVDEYYRRLKPSGAKIVRLDLQYKKLHKKRKNLERRLPLTMMTRTGRRLRRKMAMKVIMAFSF
jgi:ribosomal protein S18 acetylase RimI-like enzyme